jgi:hypothetical protein
MLQLSGQLQIKFWSFINLNLKLLKIILMTLMQKPAKLYILVVILIK